MTSYIENVQFNTMTNLTTIKQNNKIFNNYLWALPKNENPKENHFICMWSYCNQTFFQLEELDEHLTFHLKEYEDSIKKFEETINCQIRGCEILVTSIDELSRHLKMHIFHAQKQIVGLATVRTYFPDLSNCNFPSSSRLVYQGDALICEWGKCRQNFVDINIYVNHLLMHVQETKGKFIDCHNQFSCEWGNDCKLNFNSKSGLRTHVQRHSGDKMCACPFCGTFIANNTKLLDHVARRQLGNFQYNCFFCQKTFKTARLLKSHCERHLRNRKCLFCMMVVDSAFDLKRHVASVHAKIRNHFCEICKKGFYQKSDLVKHMHTHNKQLLFECKKCNMKYRWEKQLKYHQKSHDEDYIESPYLCHICEARYRRGSALSEHFSSKHYLQVPEGFSRFQYKKCSDGLYRLQTKRWLSKKFVSNENKLSN